jgi:hypothetical protein
MKLIHYLAIIIVFSVSSIHLEAKKVCFTLYNDQELSKRKVSVGSYPSGTVKIRDISTGAQRGVTGKFPRNETIVVTSHEAVNRAGVDGTFTLDTELLSPDICYTVRVGDGLGNSPLFALGIGEGLFKS